MNRAVPLLITLLGLALPGVVFAADTGIPALTLTTGEDGSTSYSVTLQVLALMTMLTFLPAMLMMMTSLPGLLLFLQSCVRRWVCSRRRQTRLWWGWRCF